jgi:pimeloyl-ACP methyl ester carboxylesterase
MGGLLRRLPAALALAALPLSPCHIEGLPEEVLCGTHRVFEDRAAQNGRTIDLKIAVVPALRRESADDPLFVLAGGPGQGARKYGSLIPLAFREVRKTRDVVLVDLRGTGGSNPLRCDLGDPLAMLQEGALDAAPCLRTLKGDPRLYTTAPAMDDLDEVRAALGYQKINLWGGSYGTRAALVYAQRHPDRVRSVVLDGAAPFEIVLPLHNAWGAQRALDRLLADCAAERECRSAYPRLRQELDEVFSKLPVQASLRHPQTGKPLEVAVTRGVFASGLRGMLYTPAHASLIPWVIHSARQGDFAPFATLSLETAAWSTETMSLGLTLSVLCSEDVRRIRDDEAERAMRGTFLGDFEIEAWRRMCEPWPRGPLPVLDDRPVRVPALILSGDLDPVTPPRWGEAMKKHFPDALHVVVPGTAHNTSMTGCVPDLIARFVEEGKIDASCVRKIRRPPFVIDPSGTAP